MQSCCSVIFDEINQIVYGTIHLEFCEDILTEMEVLPRGLGAFLGSSILIVVDWWDLLFPRDTTHNVAEKLYQNNIGT